jgi:spore coat polysaccharide biosynthesis protein SpsF
MKTPAASRGGSPRNRKRPRVVAVIQARMGSTRLPGKVLADLEGRTMLERILARLARARGLSLVTVATTTLAEDDPIASLCRDRGIECVRGSPTDVLDRYHVAARMTEADVIVRITGDCPLIDPDLVNECVKAYLSAAPPVDLALNRLPWARTYPIGLDTEVLGRKALDVAWREAQEPYQREHVVPFLYENLDRFKMIHLQAEADYGRYRWTVDTPEDLEAVRAILRCFPGRDDFGWRDVLALMDRRPDLAAINADVVHKTHRDAE